MPVQTFNSFPRPLPDSFGGSIIKSIQKGTATIAASATSGTAIISTIVPGNSIAMITYTPASGNPNNALLVDVQITDATTLTFTRNTGSAGSAMTIYWVVYEYFSVKSKQTGLTNTATSSTTATVSPVNVNKCILYATNTTSDSSTTASFVLFRYELTNSTTITFNQVTSTSRAIQWQLLELF